MNQIKITVNKIEITHSANKRKKRSNVTFGYVKTRTYYSRDANEIDTMHLRRSCMRSDYMHRSPIYTIATRYLIQERNKFNGKSRETTTDLYCQFFSIIHLQAHEFPHARI